MKKLHKIFFSIFTVVTAFFTLAAAPPDWVNNPVISYPPNNYLAAGGQGTTLDEARDQGKAGILQGFEEEIQAQTRDWINYDVYAAAEGEEGSKIYKVSLEKIIEICLKGLADNIVIAESWSDPQGGPCYALAVLDRNKTGAAFKGLVE